MPAFFCRSSETTPVRVAKSVAGADSDVTIVHVAQDYDLPLHPIT